MRPSTLLAGVIVLCLMRVAAAGGPDLRSKSATIDSVTVDDTKIVLIVTGRCEIFLSDLSLPPEKGNARMVETDLRNCVVMIIRRDEPGTGYTNWQDHCDKAKALAGKKAWVDVQGTLSIENGKVSAVRASASAFGPSGAAGSPAEP